MRKTPLERSSGPTVVASRPRATKRHTGKGRHFELPMRALCRSRSLSSSLLDTVGRVGVANSRSAGGRVLVCVCARASECESVCGLTGEQVGPLDWFSGCQIRPLGGATGTRLQRGILKPLKRCRILR